MSSKTELKQNKNKTQKQGPTVCRLFPGIPDDSKFMVLRTKPLLSS